MFTSGYVNHKLTIQFLFHCYVKSLKQPSVVFQTGCDILVILVLTYLMSRCFFMIAQTRQFPTMSTMTSTECTVAMAIPDDSIMTECCCWYYTVARSARFNEEIRKSEFLITRWLFVDTWHVRENGSAKHWLLNIWWIFCLVMLPWI